jgi:hypothetical protein
MPATGRFGGGMFKSLLHTHGRLARVVRDGFRQSSDYAPLLYPSASTIRPSRTRITFTPRTDWLSSSPQR